jgi:putative membrane protein
MQAFRWIAALAGAAFLAAGAPGALAQSKEAKLPKQDAQLMQRLAEADMAEVAAGKVAQRKASSEKVKAYAEHMVEDHGKMIEEKKEMAKAKGASLPARPAKKHQAAVQKLQGLSGSEFDREYMAQMVKDHEEALQLARRAARNAKDPELRASAKKGAREIEEHLKEAKELHASLKSSASRGSSKQD